MADPNLAAVLETMAYVAKALDEHETYTSTGTTGLLATTEDLRNDLEGDWAQALTAEIQNLRDAGAAVLTKAQARALVEPLIRQAAVAIGVRQAPIPVLFEKLYDHMVANSLSINDPEDTIDTTATAGGGNVGNATVFVLDVGPDGNDLGHLTDTLTITCTADARTLGKTQIERWLVEGGAARTDNMDYTGTGVSQALRTLSGDLSARFVLNPSFNNTSQDGSSNLTALDGWTQITGASLSTNLAVNATYTARQLPGDTANTSLQFNGDETIVQDLVAVRGAQIAQDVPYLISVAVAKVGTPTGTFTLRLSGTTGSGGVSATLAHGAMTGSGTFDRLQITGANCWGETFNANDLKLQIALASSGSMDASNYFVVDDVMFTPLQRILDFGDPRTGRGSMGRWVGITGGSTPAVKDDLYTPTDTLNGTRATNQWLLTKICHLGALPQVTGGTETTADK